MREPRRWTMPSILVVSTLMLAPTLLRAQTAAATPQELVDAAQTAAATAQAAAEAAKTAAEAAQAAAAEDAATPQELADAAQTAADTAQTAAATAQAAAEAAKTAAEAAQAAAAEDAATPQELADAAQTAADTAKAAADAAQAAADETKKAAAKLEKAAAAEDAAKRAQELADAAKTAADAAKKAAADAAKDPHGPHVVFGVGAAAMFGGSRLTEAVVDEQGIVRVTSDRETIRPVATAGYLMPCGKRNRDKKIRCGVMGVVDAELFGKGNLLEANGVGVGFQLAFRSAEGVNWDRSFGIGIAYMRDVTATKLRNDFVDGMESPETEVQFVKTHADTVLLVLTYSFGRPK